ncbi:hypothetical protein SprV_0200701200 [Sparganum proliferum]
MFPSTSTINTDRTPKPPLPSSSSIASTSAAATPIHTTTAYNPDTPTNINIPTVYASNVDSIHIYPHCDRNFTPHIGLVDHSRIHRTGEPVPGAPNYTRRTRFHCPHCHCTFTHRMGLFDHIRIHESGIDRSLDTPITSCTHITPNLIHTPQPSTPTTMIPNTLTTSCTRTMPNPTHTPTLSASTISSSTTATISETDNDTADFSRPKCPGTFISHIGLVGYLRIHCTETGEPVPRAPTYTRRIRLNSPHCTFTLTHRMGLLGDMRIHEN